MDLEMMSIIIDPLQSCQCLPRWKTRSKSLTNYVNEKNLIFKYQSAFRENHSTETALIKWTDELLFNRDNDKGTGMILIDFKKAFDLVNHETLLQKLQMYGLSDSAVKWFHSYLSDRQQCVKVNECTSSLLPINQGIPKGTIVGPMLFLIFIKIGRASCRERV